MFFNHHLSHDLWSFMQFSNTLFSHSILHRTTLHVWYFYVRTFRAEKIKSINNCQKCALVISKEQTKRPYDSYTQSNNLEHFSSLFNQRHLKFQSRLHTMVVYVCEWGWIVFYMGTTYSARLTHSRATFPRILYCSTKENCLCGYMYLNFLY